MFPPRFVPPGILQLFEVNGEEKTLLKEVSTSSRGRESLQRMRNDLLMLYPTKTYIITENNAKI